MTQPLSLGSFWHIGHKENAGECTGFISTPNDVICVEVNQLLAVANCNSFDRF